MDICFWKWSKHGVSDGTFSNLWMSFLWIWSCRDCSMWIICNCCVPHGLRNQIRFSFVLTRHGFKPWFSLVQHNTIIELAVGWWLADSSIRVRIVYPDKLYKPSLPIQLGGFVPWICPPIFGWPAPCPTIQSTTWNRQFIHWSEVCWWSS